MSRQFYFLKFKNMKKLENYGLVELNAIEMISIDGGFVFTPIFTASMAFQFQLQNLIL